jgi:hypothetical protein
MVEEKGAAKNGTHNEQSPTGWLSMELEETTGKKGTKAEYPGAVKNSVTTHLSLHITDTKTLGWQPRITDVLGVFG